MFGLPRLAPAPNGFCGADVDDGTGTGTPDGGVDVNDFLFFFTVWEAGNLAADLDDGSGLGIPDDGVDANDLLYFLTAFEEGTRGGDINNLRFAWRGYRWDKHLQLYHVRHRAFDPKLMVWLQPDPLGEIDGPNPYAYVGWDPFNRIDPYGLQARASEGFAFDPWAPVPIELITSLQDFRRLEDHARNSTDHSYTVRLRNNVDIIYTWNGTGWDAKKTTHDGQVIEARLPSAVVQKFHSSGKRRAALVQAESPEVSLPPGTDMKRLGEIGLRVLGVRPDEARRLAGVIDWNSTLLVPVLASATHFQQVSVNGARGVMLQTTSTATPDGSDRGPGSVLMWTRNGRVYALLGNVGDVDMVQMAESVR